jgi:hypothetical protein
LGDAAGRNKGQHAGMQVKKKKASKDLRISPKDKEKTSGLNRRKNQEIKANRNRRNVILSNYAIIED